MGWYTKMKLICKNCGVENVFPEDERYEVFEHPDYPTIQIKLTTKTYYCEVCGCELA